MSLRLNLSFSSTGASFPAIVVGAVLVFFLFFPLLLFPTCPFVSQLYFYVLVFSSFHNILLFVFPASGRRFLSAPPKIQPTPTIHIPFLGLSPTMDAAAPRSLALHILAFDSLSSFLLILPFQYPHKG